MWVFKVKEFLSEHFSRIRAALNLLLHGFHLSPSFLLGLLALSILYTVFTCQHINGLLCYFLSGFSIKAVPFSNAILNVKELGGKKHTPNTTRKQPDFHFPPIVNVFRAKALLSNGIFRIQCLKKLYLIKLNKDHRPWSFAMCGFWFFFSTCSDLTYKHICFFCSSSITISGGVALVCRCQAC